MMMLLLATAMAAALMLPSALSVSTSAASIFQHVLVVSSEQLEELRQSSSISMVYFFVNGSQNDQEFFGVYERSAKYLEVYNITLAVFNCSSDVSDHGMCKKEKVGHHVYIYQNGTELLTFKLEEMFDVNSIMANALQLALLHQVPIVQTRQELQELQRTALGRQDILFAFPVGHETEDHRIFLEIAYAFHDRFKFVLTTEFKVTQGLQDSELLKPNMHFAMWVLFCAESTAKKMSRDKICHSVPYRGEMSLTAIGQFVKRLSEKTLYHMPADGSIEVFDKTDNLPIIFAYIHKDMQDELAPIIDMSKFEVRGVAKVVVVDMDDKDCQSLAEQHGVSGELPTIGIRQNGVMTFLDQNKEWSADNIQEFIRSQVFPFDPLSSRADVELHSDISMINEQVETQDDQIAAAVTKLSENEIKLDHIPALLKHNFYKTLASADLKMVLFYLPFDHISMAFLREFGYAAEILARNFSETNVLARVNCYDGTDVCAAENITTYPLLRIFWRGQDRVDYTISLDYKSVIRAVKLLKLRSPVKLMSEEEVESFLKGKHPLTFHTFTPSSVLLLTSTEDTDEERIFSNVAKSMSMITAFGVVHGEEARFVSKIYSVSIPSVVAFHRSDINRPMRTFNHQLSESSLTDFAKSSLIATVPELTVMNLPTLFAKKQPFAILFVDSSDPGSEVAKETFTQTAMSGQFENAIFCWMRAQDQTIGHKILSEYTWTPTLPMVTVVDHQRGQLFNYLSEQFKLEDISEWLTRVLTKRVKPSKMLEYAKWVPPGPHYDFLDLIDKMERGEQNDDDTVDEDYWFKEEQKITSQLSDDANNDQDEALKIDDDARKELLDLHKSRIYRQNPERRDGKRKKLAMEQGSSSHHTQLHVEL